MNVVNLRAKLTESRHELSDAIDTVNHVLGGPVVAKDGGISGMTGGSNVNKRRRNRNKYSKEKQSESSIHPTRPSSHTAHVKKSRLDHD